MLLHFVLVLHFAAIVITFCGDYYILRRNSLHYEISFFGIFHRFTNTIATKKPYRASCVFSGASMWKIAKKTEISKASIKLGQTPWYWKRIHSSATSGAWWRVLSDYSGMTRTTVKLQAHDVCHWTTTAQIRAADDQSYSKLLFSQASERSGILNPWIWLANCARSSGPDFPIRTPRTDRSWFSSFRVFSSSFFLLQRT